MGEPGVRLDAPACRGHGQYTVTYKTGITLKTLSRIFRAVLDHNYRALRRLDFTQT